MGKLGVFLNYISEPMRAPSPVTESPLKDLGMEQPLPTHAPTHLLWVAVCQFVGGSAGVWSEESQSCQGTRTLEHTRASTCFSG